MTGLPHVGDVVDGKYRVDRILGTAETVLPPTRDFRGDPCNALSFGAAFTAFPSLPSSVEFDGRRKDASDERDCGPEWRDTCPAP
jgi:hypothetical protein